MSGLDSTGFSAKLLTEVLTEIEDEEKAQISESVNVQATAILGVLNGIVADPITEAWELGQTVYNQLNPDSAEGTALDNIGALRGLRVRLAATQATAPIVCAGTAGTALASGRSVTLNTYDWSTTAAATITAASAWVNATAYVVGDYVENDTPDKIYYCTVAGTSAGAGGPTGTGQAIVDNTATWKYVGTGDGYATPTFTADDYGPGPTGLTANTATIGTAVTGWNTAIFLTDSTAGRNQETDAAYRLAQATLLQESGNATRDAIRSDVGSVSGVTSVQIYVNNTDAIDGDGVPAHGFEVVVLGGTDNAVAQAILDSEAAGIEDHGSDTGTAADDEGNNHTMEFSRPTSVPIHTIVDLTKDADYPATGDAQVQAAIATTFEATLEVGDDVVQSQMYEFVFAIDGVVDVTKIWIGIADPPLADTTIVITSRQLATFDSGDVDVTSV